MSLPNHIVCPHCHTTNRVASEDLAKAPDSGKCHQPLFVGHSVMPASDFTDTELKK